MHKKVPLIDSDVLRYEIGFCGEYKNEEGENITRGFEFVKSLLDGKIEDICSEVDATDPPILFLTNDRRTSERHHRRYEKIKKWNDEAVAPEEFKENYRMEVAKTKPYKGNRKKDKPFHYDNLTEYMLNNYTCNIANGIEADDAMGIYQCESEPGTTIICSRDKDLRMIPGLHYSWECGRQNAIGPIKVSEKGKLGMLNGKFLGTGLSFFYYQMLVGDSVDNILGCKGCGPAKAKPLLEQAQDEQAMFEAVRKQYETTYGEEEYKTYMRENADLLWILRRSDQGYIMVDERG